jgi:hypothetical protein
MAAETPSTTLTRSTSRRALLAGALGGVGALAASAIGRASPAQGAEDEAVFVGGNYSATTNTGFSTTNQDALYGMSQSAVGVVGGSNSGLGVLGSSSTNNGVSGESSAGIGVRGFSATSDGVQGVSDGHSGVVGISNATSWPAVGSWSKGNSTGVEGYSGAALPKAAPAKTGVFGYAAQDATSVGVRGESPAGYGIYGKTTGTGFAGYFNGKTFMSQFVEIAEITSPAAPGGNRARLFVRDNGAGKTQLCVRFPTGAIKILATES